MAIRSLPSNKENHDERRSDEHLPLRELHLQELQLLTAAEGM